MAPRRTYRSVKVDNNNVNINLVLNDVLCPICRSILIEPVTIPCNHGFCLSCFEGTVANASLTCPLCRVRFSSWHRLAKKDNKIVNINLWEAIKSTFPKQVENKLNGVEENFGEEQSIILATPGQIRKEYEEQRKKELLEIRKEQEAEAKASEELIKKIVKNEAQEESDILRDEKFARKLAKELNTSNLTIHSEEKCKGTMQKNGPLDKFLQNVKDNNPKTSKVSSCIKTFSKKEVPQTVEFTKKECVTRILYQDNKQSKHVKNVSTNEKVTKNGTLNNITKQNMESNNKTNTTDHQFRYFKPIDLKNIPPSKIVPILKVPAKLTKACTVIIGGPSGETNFTHNHLLSAFARFEMTSPILGISSKQSTNLPKRNQNRKRKYSNDCFNMENIILNESVKQEDGSSMKFDKSNVLIGNRPSIRRSNRILSMDKTSDRAATIQHIERSPNTRSKQRIINKIVEECLNEETTSSKQQLEYSLPFHGFEPVHKKNIDCDVKLSSSVSKEEEERLLQKKVQEANDLELAKKMQEELNKGRYSTRSSIIHSNKFCKKHRQVKLDEIIKCRNKVK